MNTKKFKKASLFLMLSLTSLAFPSCEESSAGPKMPAEEGYFPLNNNSRWEYILDHYSKGTDEFIKTDTINYGKRRFCSYGQNVQKNKRS